MALMQMVKDILQNIRQVCRIAVDAAAVRDKVLIVAGNEEPCEDIIIIVRAGGIVGVACDAVQIKVTVQNAVAVGVRVGLGAVVYNGGDIVVVDLEQRMIGRVVHRAGGSVQTALEEIVVHGSVLGPVCVVIPCDIDMIVLVADFDQVPGVAGVADMMPCPRTLIA